MQNQLLTSQINTKEELKEALERLKSTKMKTFTSQKPFRRQEYPNINDHNK